MRRKVSYTRTTMLSRVVQKSATRRKRAKKRVVRYARQQVRLSMSDPKEERDARVSRVRGRVRKASRRRDGEQKKRRCRKMWLPCNARMACLLVLHLFGPKKRELGLYKISVYLKQKQFRVLLTNSWTGRLCRFLTTSWLLAILYLLVCGCCCNSVDRYILSY